jgi:hypothetical protein
LGRHRSSLVRALQSEHHRRRWKQRRHPTKEGCTVSLALRGVDKEIEARLMQ